MKDSRQQPQRSYGPSCPFGVNQRLIAEGGFNPQTADSAPEAKTLRPSPPTVSVIIVNWNRLSYLENCVRSLRAGTYTDLEIIVVDNGSTDGSAEWVEAQMRMDARIGLIRNPCNLGFAGPCNQGAAAARGKILFLLNNDTQVDPDCIARVVAFLSGHPDIGVVQPSLLKSETRMDEQGGFLLWNGYLAHMGFMGERSDIFRESYPVFAVKGAAFFARRELVARIGLFREDFFAFYEETDFCHRAWRSGSRVAYFGGASVLHIGHVTVSEMKKMPCAKIWYRSYRNRLISLFTLLDRRHVLSMLLPHLGFNAFCAVVFCFLGRFELVSAILRSHLHVLVQLPGLRKTRRSLRATFCAEPERFIFQRNGLRIRIPLAYYPAFLRGRMPTFWSKPRIQAWTLRVISKRLLTTPETGAGHPRHPGR